MRGTVDMWMSSGGLDVIIGDGCSVVCQPVSLLAAAWGIPVVSWGCSSSTLSNKNIYPTFTRTKGTWMSLGPVFSALADTMGWNTVAILTSPEDVFRLAGVSAKKQSGCQWQENIL